MKRIFISCVCGGLLATSSSVSAFEQLEVNELVEKTLRQSPRLQAVQSRLRQQNVEVDIARDGRWPTLNGYVEQASASESRQQFRVSQKVYDWGTTSGKIELAKIEASLIELEYLHVQEEEAKELIELILDWSSSGNRKEVLQAHLQRLREIERLTALRVGNVIDRGELSRVSAAIAGAQIELTLAESAIGEASDQVQERIGQPVNLNHLRDLPGFDQWFVDGLSMASLSPLMPLAPPVQDAELGIAKAEPEKTLATSEWRPTLSVDAIAERTEDRFGSNTDQRIALRIETPIFQGLAAFRRPKAAEHALTTAIRQRDRELSNVRRTVQRLTNSIRLQTNRRPLIDRQVQASRATMELYTQQFRIGRRDMSDLIGAEGERLNAELSAIDLKYEQQRLTLRLSSVLGLLTAKLSGTNGGRS
ncbi:TolC family protein [Marinobacter litoralis]|uniref:TolC family protein n=1 Tax=Marinobacter litoralis TaxID=187981 RepID=UPI0018ED4FB5|nr:TolC family protein [Marinobacter litoralis]MBJ6138915.1 TolC family protein [Marinobacter litoralis]